MNLEDMIASLASGLLRKVTAVPLDVPVTDVVIYEAGADIAGGSIVLAVGVDLSRAEARDLLRNAGDHQAAAVIFRASEPDVPVALGEQRLAVFALERHVPWGQLHILLRALLTAGQEESPLATDSPEFSGTLHGLAEVIAVMVGGSVVLYDRAHRVLAYSTQDDQIDSVRRDTILGKRTPEQWIQRFTLDRSAYQTYRRPGKVVRVEHYSGLRTRLRIAVHTGGAVLGEISVAEASRPLGPKSEKALERAAKIAAPYFLQSRMSEDAHRAADLHMLDLLLRGDPAVEAQSAKRGLDPRGGLTPIGFRIRSREDVDHLHAELFTERVAHLLTLHMQSVHAASAVLYAGPHFYAVVPTTTEDLRGSLRPRIQAVLRQLERLDMTARAVIGHRVDSLAAMPAARSQVDDVLLALSRSTSVADVVMPEDAWAELTLLSARRGVELDGRATVGAVDLLLRHDLENGTEYVKTLKTYLDAFGSVAAAAEALILHPNTLRHRLQRLSEVSGLNIADATQRLAVGLQLYSGQPEEKPNGDG